MKTFAIAALFTLVAGVSFAAIVHDESIHGDLSTNAAAPTALVFTYGPNTVSGTTGNPGTIDRDYLTFTIGGGERLAALNLIAFSPDNLAFAAFNAGSTSFVPGAGTAASFLAGIHPTASDIGTNLLLLFVSSSVTGNSLPAAELGPGTYSFVIQQTNNIVQTYSLEFVVEATVPTEERTWGLIKALYR